MSEYPQHCPISGTKIDETVVRLIAAQVAVLATVATITQHYSLAAILALDFAVRALGFAPFSVLRTVAKGIKTALNLPAKMTDEAPKRFAAAIGFGVMTLLALTLYFDWLFTALAIGGLITTFAVLESTLAVCVGCILYGYTVRFRPVK